MLAVSLHFPTLLNWLHFTWHIQFKVWCCHNKPLSPPKITLGRPHQKAICIPDSGIPEKTGWAWIVLNRFTTHPANTRHVVPAEDESRSLRSTRLPADHLRQEEVRGWEGPRPHCRDRLVSLRKWVQEERQKKNKWYNCFSSPCSLHIVVEDAGIHLCVSGWWHKLELRGIHKNRAVWRTIHVI